MIRKPPAGKPIGKTMIGTPDSAPTPGAEFSGDPYLPAHGNGGYRVEHYDLDLDYRVEPNRLAGRATITAAATQALSTFSLDLSGFRLAGVTVDGRSAKFTRRGHKLVVRPARAIRVDSRFTVEVRYAGTPTPVSGVWGDIGWDELENGVLVASQPIGAPSWFPCDDHPAATASFRVAMTVASSYSVLVTGNLVSKRRKSSTTKWVYERGEPTPTYLMGVQIGQYEDVAITSDPVRQRAAVPRPQLATFAHDFGRQPEIMATLERLFGPYPFDEYVIVVTEDELEDPIEAQGMSVFGANHLDGRRTHERLAVHELAHQWFGNSLTVADWRQIWLNEGFATYAEWLWSELSGGRPAGDHAREWYAHLAAAPADLKVADPGMERMFDTRLYKRGAITLHALRRRIGDDRFFPLLRDWATEFRHRPVNTADFITFANQRTARPLDSLFASWLDTPALPSFPT